MDHELRAYLDERFGAIDQRFERVEETVRHTQVLVEGLRHENRLIAEALIGVTEQLKTAAVSFEVVKGWLEPFYVNLNNRVVALEDRAERQRGDVMDAVRKIVGQPPLNA